MSSTRDLVIALKAELRRARITYADVAAGLGVAESTVKRLFAKGDMPLSRVDQVLALLRMDFADLARQVASARPVRRQLSLEQERAVVADPRLLLVAICALSEWTFEQIVRTYAIEEAQAVAWLVALDRLGILELRAHNRYRLKIDKTFRWRPDGPVMQYFRSHVVDDYFAGGFDDEGEVLMLVHGQVSPAHAGALTDRLQRVIQDFAQQHRADRDLSTGERRAYTIVVGMRSWLFAPFRDLRRAKS